MIRTNPGHIPPHIVVRSVRDAALECGADTASWFDFDKHRCDIVPDILLKLIRKYYPRDANGDVHYPEGTEKGPAFWKYVAHTNAYAHTHTHTLPPPSLSSI